MEPKRFAIASDHAGFDMKVVLVADLRTRGVDVVDLGTNGSESVDYPDYAQALAQSILSGDAEAGVLICGTGIGMSIAANRYPGIRAALVHDPETARMARAHNDANVLVLGGRVLDEALAKRCLDLFLSTPFEGGRHQRRVDKMSSAPSAAVGQGSAGRADG